MNTQKQTSAMNQMNWEEIERTIKKKKNISNREISIEFLSLRSSLSWQEKSHVLLFNIKIDGVVGDSLFEWLLNDIDRDPKKIINEVIVNIFVIINNIFEGNEIDQKDINIFSTYSIFKRYI